jgi:hypothetical protein
MDHAKESVATILGTLSFADFPERRRGGTGTYHRPRCQRQRPQQKPNTRMNEWMNEAAKGIHAFLSPAFSAEHSQYLRNGMLNWLASSAR